MARPTKTESLRSPARKSRPAPRRAAALAAALVLVLAQALAPLAGAEIQNAGPPVSRPSPVINAATRGRPASQRFFALPEQVRRSAHRFVPEARGDYASPIWVRDLKVRLSGSGLEIVPRPIPGLPWSLSIQVTGFGRAGLTVPVADGHPTTAGDRVEIHHGSFTEWYRFDEKGIEQGFDIPAAPGRRTSNRPLVIEMALGGGLQAAPASGGKSVLLRTEAGVVVFRYTGLKVLDRHGRALSAGVEVTAEGLRIEIDDRQASYPLQVDPLLTSSAWTASFGTSVASAGDVNGDGYDDVIISGAGDAYLYLGSASGLALSPAWRASPAGTVAGAGDVNGDGYADVVVGGSEVASIYLGSASGLATSPAWSAAGDLAPPGFGLSVDGAGDVNGDGYDDVLVGASPAWPGGSSPGKAFLYLGSPFGPSSSPDWTSSGDQWDGAFGFSVAPAGDVNGDGFDDVLVGEPGFDYPEPIDRPNAGKALLYLGASAGLSLTAAWETQLVNRFAFLGSSVSTAGDVNQDGFADIIVGGFNGFSAEMGVAQAFLGSASGPETSASWMVQGDHPLAHLGTSVSIAGDVNGDGFSDVAVGEPDYDRSFDEESVGRVYLFPGAADGLVATPAWSADGDSPFLFLGSSVATAGDVNGDGFSDVLVGAPGAAILYLGGPDNRPPVARAAAPVQVECGSPAGAAVVLDGSASTDPDSMSGTNDDIVAYEWFENYGQTGQVRIGTGETPTVSLSLGSHLVTLVVRDGGGATSTDSVTVDVADTTPPVLALAASPALLWPPSHQMVNVHVNATAVDACGPSSMILVSVASNEPDDVAGPVDGNTLQDIQEVELDTADFEFRLRAERSDSGTGRIYTVIYRAADASANLSGSATFITVPLSLDGSSGKIRPPVSRGDTTIQPE